MRENFWPAVVGSLSLALLLTLFFAEKIDEALDLGWSDESN